MCADRLLSCLALLLTAALGLNTIAPPVVDAPTVPAPPLVVDEDVEARIGDIAEAIATAEGYYADGEHDGHSLPYRLNNPGALKKPALGAAGLPTWQDTGLVVFPTADAGWAALHHQVRMMVNGDSRIYEPTDSIHTVAIKYTGGDASASWGSRVAAQLGVAPGATLAEVSSMHAP